MLCAKLFVYVLPFVQIPEVVQKAPAKPRRGAAAYDTPGAARRAAGTLRGAGGRQKRRRRRHSRRRRRPRDQLQRGARPGQQRARLVGRLHAGRPARTAAARQPPTPRGAATGQAIQLRLLPKGIQVNRNSLFFFVKMSLYLF